MPVIGCRLLHQLPTSQSSQPTVITKSHQPTVIVTNTNQSTNNHQYSPVITSSHPRILDGTHISKPLPFSDILKQLPRHFVPWIQMIMMTSKLSIFSHRSRIFRSTHFDLDSRPSQNKSTWFIAVMIWGRRSWRSSLTSPRKAGRSTGLSSFTIRQVSRGQQTNPWCNFSLLKSRYERKELKTIERRFIFTIFA